MGRFDNPRQLMVAAAPLSARRLFCALGMRQQDAAIFDKIDLRGR
jgi:hypothetical protein